MESGFTLRLFDLRWLRCLHSAALTGPMEVKCDHSPQSLWQPYVLVNIGDVPKTFREQNCWNFITVGFHFLSWKFFENIFCTVAGHIELYKFHNLLSLLPILLTYLLSWWQMQTPCYFPPLMLPLWRVMLMTSTIFSNTYKEKAYISLYNCLSNCAGSYYLSQF